MRSCNFKETIETWATSCNIKYKTTLINLHKTAPFQNAVLSIINKIILHLPQFYDKLVIGAAYYDGG